MGSGCSCDSRKQKIEKVLECWSLLETLNQSSLPEERKRPAWEKRSLKEGEEGFDPCEEKEVFEVKHVFVFAESDASASCKTMLDHAMDATLGSGKPNEVLDVPYSDVTLYLGEIPRDVLNECVGRMRLSKDLKDVADLAEEAEVSDDFFKRKVAAATVSLDTDGVISGFSLSPLLWGLKHGGESIGDGLLRSYRNEMEDIFREIRSENPDSLTYKDVESIIRCYVIEEDYFQEFGIEEKINACCDLMRRNGFEGSSEASFETLLYSCRVEVNASERPFIEKDAFSDSFTKLFNRNSFFQKDLENLLRLLRNATSLEEVNEGALSLVVNYLQGGFSECDERNRLDLMNGDEEECLKVFQDVLSYRNLPLGRWPSKYSPVLMQQMAINLIVGRKTGRGETCSEERSAYLANDIVSVNGPPGTGKTTLLKEVIAACVVEKARILAGIDGEPDDIFEEIDGVKKHLGASSAYRIKPEFDAINDYGILVCSSNNKAVENISKEFSDGDNFFDGLTLAIREEFDNFCTAGDEGVDANDLGDEGEGASKAQPDLYFSRAATRQFGKDAKADKEHPDLLIAARLGNRDNIEAFSYRAKGKKEDNVLNEIVEAYDSAPREMRLLKWRQIAKEFLALYEKIDAMFRDLGESLEGCAGSRSDGEERLVKGCGWVDGQLIKDMRLTNANRDEAKNERRRKAQLFSPSPRPEEASGSHEEALLSEARDRLFLLALQVTKEFVLASRCMKSNIQSLRSIWVGMGARHKGGSKTAKYSQSELGNVMPALFQTLNILTPVISSAFASIGSQRMFGHVPMRLDGKAPFGLLVIDEAGQVVPAAAVGAFARCRKAMVVGDPSQIEPVVTEALDSIRNRMSWFLAGESNSISFFSKAASVQQFADRRNPVGTKNVGASDDGDDSWIGCPLIVHRRCSSPMFEISNRLCYGGTMLKETVELKRDDPKNDRFYLSSSRWMNVSGRERGEKNHYVDKQGERAAEIVVHAFKANEGKLPSLYVISPFKTVSESFKKYLEGQKEELFCKCDDIEISDDEFKSFCSNNIGTVHTFQGKEADEVVFMLGCDEMALGAVKWVNSHIVNVAASRAKRRLYIIGDENVWKQNEHVKVAFTIISTLWVEHYKRWMKEPDTERGKAELELAAALFPQLDEMANQAEGSDETGRDEYIVDVAAANINSEETGPVIDGVLDESVYRKFGFENEEEFENEFAITFKRCDADFDSALKAMLVTLQWGMFQYIVAENFTDDSDMRAGVVRSACGAIFSKAFETYLQNIVLPLLKRRKPVCRDVEGDTPTIGKYKRPLKEAKEEFAGFCRDEESSFGNACSYTSEWWERLGTNMGKIAKLRNACSHGQEMKGWDEATLRRILAWLLNPSGFVKPEDDLDQYPLPEEEGLMRSGEAFWLVYKGQNKKLKMVEDATEAEFESETDFGDVP